MFIHSRTYIFIRSCGALEDQSFVGPLSCLCILGADAAVPSCVRAGRAATRQTWCRRGRRTCAVRRRSSSSTRSGSPGTPPTPTRRTKTSRSRSPSAPSGRASCSRENTPFPHHGLNRGGLRDGHLGRASLERRPSGGGEGVGSLAVRHNMAGVGQHLLPPSIVCM